jgi:hypothetical protein
MPFGPTFPNGRPARPSGNPDLTMHSARFRPQFDWITPSKKIHRENTERRAAIQINVSFRL